MTQQKQDKRFLARYVIGMLSPWVILTGIALWLIGSKPNSVLFFALLVPVTAAAMYFVHRRTFYHYKCRDCKSRCEPLFKTKGDPVNFHCDRCNTSWQTGLIFRADD